jgi:quinol monooxygenase YgiN
MEKIRLIARVIAKPGRESELRGLLRGMLVPSRAEAGCELYELYESTEPGRFYFNEIWKSKDLLDRHMDTPSFRHLKATLPELLAEPLEMSFVRAVSEST